MLVRGRLALVAAVLVVASCSSPGEAPVSSGRTTHPTSSVTVGFGEVVPPGTPDPVAARAMLELLPVQDHAPAAPGLDEGFGRWADPDGNGCDGRRDALALWWRGSTVGCGEPFPGRWTEPYSGESVTEGDVEVDRVVSLGSAWVAGASGWTPQRRSLFANDPGNLVPTTSVMVIEKRSAGVAEWLPRREDYWCEYASIAVGTRSAYSLSVSVQEQQALGLALDTCVSVSPETLGP